MRYRDLHSLDPHGCKHGNGIVNGFTGPRNNRLSRAVFIGYSHVSRNTRQFRFYFFNRRRDRGHLPVVFHANFTHHFPAGTYGFKTVFKIKNTGCHGSGVFTQTVPHDYVRFNTKRGQQAHHGDIGRKYRRLGHFGFLNGRFPYGNLFFGLAGFAP